MAEVVDLTSLGNDKDVLTRAVNNAVIAAQSSGTVIEAFKMTKAQGDLLLKVLVQSSVNRRSNAKRPALYGIPVVEV